MQLQQQHDKSKDANRKQGPNPFLDNDDFVVVKNWLVLFKDESN